MMKRQKVFSAIGYIFLGVIALCGALITTAAIMIHQAPVDARFLLSYLPGKAQADALVLHWPHVNEPMNLTGRNLAYEDRHGLKVNVEGITASAKLSKFMRGNFSPQDVLIEGLTITFPEKDPATEDQKFQLDFALPEIIDNVLAIKNFKFSRVTIVRGDVRWSGDLDWTRLKNKMSGNFLFANQTGKAHLKGAITYDHDSEKYTLKGDYDGLSHRDLGIQGPCMIENLSGTVLLKGLGETLESCTIKGQRGKVTLHHEAFDKDIQIQNATYDLYIKEGKAGITRLLLPLPGGGSAQVSGQLTTGLLSKNGKIDGKVILTDVPFNNVRGFWPTKAAEGAREWVTGQIKDGRIPHAEMNFEGIYEPSRDKDAFELKGLKGFIDLTQAKLTYVDTMPLVENLSAKAYFNEDGFDIKVLGGSNNNVRIKTGRVVIEKFSDPITTLSIDVDVQGELPDVLTIIDAEPLTYCKDNQLIKEGSQGTVQANLKMSFPLEDVFDPKKIKTQVKAQVQKARLKNPLALPVVVQDGSLAVDLDDDRLIIGGNALFNGSQSSINMTYPFDPKKTGDVKLVGRFSLKSIQAFDIPLEGIIFETIPATILYHMKPNDLSHLSVTSNWVNEDVQVLSFKKPKGTAAVMHLEADFIKRKLKKIQALKIKGDQLSLQGNAEFSEGLGSDVVFHLNAPQIGLSDFQLDGTFKSADGWRINLKSRTLDLGGFLEKYNEEEPSQESSSDMTLFLRSDVDRLQLMHGVTYDDNTITLTMKQGYLDSLQASGNRRGSKENTGYKISSLTQSDVRQFTLETKDAGSFLKGLGKVENIVGGHLMVRAKSDMLARRTRDSWQGKVKIEDFKLLKAPFLTRFLSMVFPTGLSDLGSEGLSFREFKLAFVMTPRRIDISSGKAFGNSLGFSFKGHVNREKAEGLYITGSVIPAYFLNTLVSKIPFFGALLSGGKDEGVFGASFTMTGSAQDPKTSVNPLSTLTPGILRKIFGSLDDSDFEDADDEKDFITSDR